MKIVFLLVGILCLANVAFSQQATIKGKVTSFGMPVSGVTVSVTSKDSAEYSAITDLRGEYNIIVASPGEYRLIVKKDNVQFYSGAATAVRVDGNRSTTLHIDLPGISEVVNVAAGDAQRVEQVSKTVDVIDGQEMRERADITLTDSLRTIPGFRVQQLGGVGRVATIKTRGLRNQDTAILIDGIRLRDATAITGDASPFLGDITLTSVSRVEVLRGPGSSLYGTNAIGGTVDLQTPTPPSGWHGQISGAGGGLGFGRFRGNVSYGTSDNKFGFNTGVSRTIFTKGVDRNDEAKNTNFQGRVDVKPTSQTSISGRFFFSDAFVQLNTDPDTAGTPPTTNTGIVDAVEGVNFISDPDDPDRTQKSNFFNGQIKINHAVSNGFDIQGYYAGLKTERRNDNGVLGAGFQSEGTSLFDGQIHTANARGRWTAGQVNTLTFGYEFEKEKYYNEGITPGGFGDFFTRAGQSSNTIYVNDNVSLDDGQFQLSGGLRAQFFSLDEPGFSETNAPYSGLSLNDPPSAVTYDASASYFFRSTGTKLRTHFGTSYRVPSLYERFGSFFNSFAIPPSPPFVIIGDPFLGPEKGWAFDAGVDQNIAGNKVQLSAVYFYTSLRDTIFYANIAPDIGDDPRPFGGYVNQEGGTAKGIELSGRIKPTSTTDIFASYTYTSSRQFEPQVAGSGILTSLGIPNDQFTFVATQRFGDFWVNLDLLITSSYLAPIFSNSTFNSYVYRFVGNRRGDLTAGYTFRFDGSRYNLRVFGTVENMFDNQYFENGFKTAGITARAGANFSF